MGARGEKGALEPLGMSRERAKPLRFPGVSRLMRVLGLSTAMTCQPISPVTVATTVAQLAWAARDSDPRDITVARRPGWLRVLADEALARRCKGSVSGVRTGWCGGRRTAKGPNRWHQVVGGRCPKQDRCADF